MDESLLKQLQAWRPQQAAYTASLPDRSPMPSQENGTAALLAQLRATDSTQGGERPIDIPGLEIQMGPRAPIDLPPMEIPVGERPVQLAGLDIPLSRPEGARYFGGSDPLAGDKGSDFLNLQEPPAYVENQKRRAMEMALSRALGGSPAAPR